MVEYRLVGYNSGGYRSSRTILFDGKIEKLWKPDPEYPDTERTISYFKITYPNGMVTEENNEFLQNILNTQSYIESFLVTEVIALPEDLEDKVEEDPLNPEEPIKHTLWKRILNFIRHGTY